MIVNRIEDNSNHTFYNSPVGVSDWVIRSKDSISEIQISSAYQNYGFLARVKSDSPVKISFSQIGADFKETKKEIRDGKILHFLRGLLYISTERDLLLSFPSLYLESSRAIRILQEGGEEDYQTFLRRCKTGEINYIISDSKMEMKRKYCDDLEYQLKIVTAGGKWNTLPGGILSLELPEGNNELDIELSIKGIWPDEDLSSFSDDAFKLLSPRSARLYRTLNQKKKEEMTRQLEALLLLSRKNKLLAGGPRFFTYFGRDSLISISLLSGIVIPELTIQGLKSVLARLSEKGEVAHEETLGEFASIHSGDCGGVIPEPLLEYHMVDDDFLLPAAIKHWLELEDPEILKKMLEGILQNNRSGYKLLASNLEYCRRKIGEGLIPYHTGSPVGDWRDSLAYQKIIYSYELNRGLALGFPEVYDYLTENLPALKKYLISINNREDLSESHEYFTAEASLFEREKNPEQEMASILEWLGKAGFSESEELVLKKRLQCSVAECNQYRFFAMGLRKDKSPIDVQHNDSAFNLLYGNPEVDEISMMITPFETPFPLGLRTEAGILVSNPVFCDDAAVRNDLNRSHYHGLVIWPLMHNILYHGLIRQIKRFSDSNKEEIVLRMQKLIEYLDGLDSILNDFSASELFTFSPRDDGDIPVAFGAGMGSATESNPIQLWSSLGFTKKLSHVTLLKGNN